MSDLFFKRFHAIKKSVTIEDLRRCRQERKTKFEDKILFRGLGPSLFQLEESIVEDKLVPICTVMRRGLNIELRYALIPAGITSFTQQLERALELEDIAREKVFPVASKLTSGQVASAYVAEVRNDDNNNSNPGRFTNPRRDKH